MEIVKCGGSLCRPEWQDALLDWLEARARAGPVMVVCGGGAHADLVRSEQQRMGFDDLTAHRQALLAMEQMAWWLHGAWRTRHGRVCPVRSEPGADVLWVPRDLIADPAGLEVSWSLTSDSLAAWLAARQPTRHLWLLKSLDCGIAPGGPVDWAHQGWVDPCFPGYAGRADCAISLLGRSAWASAAT